MLWKALVTRGSQNQGLVYVAGKIYIIIRIMKSKDGVVLYPRGQILRCLRNNKYWLEISKPWKPKEKIVAPDCVKSDRVSMMLAPVKLVRWLTEINFGTLK